MRFLRTTVGKYKVTLTALSGSVTFAKEKTKLKCILGCAMHAIIYRTEEHFKSVLILFNTLAPMKHVLSENMTSGHAENGKSALS